MKEFSANNDDYWENNYAEDYYRHFRGASPAADFVPYDDEYELWESL